MRLYQKLNQRSKAWLLFAFGEYQKEMKLTDEDGLLWYRVSGGCEGDPKREKKSAIRE